MTDYEGGLYTVSGEAYVKRMHESVGQPGECEIYTADGELVRNPIAYVGKLENYEGGLYTADGEEIRNPMAYVNRSSSSFMFKADGTAIKNPKSYLAHMANYEGGLFTSSGQEIRDPEAFLRAREGGGRGEPWSGEAWSDDGGLQQSGALQARATKVPRGGKAGKGGQGQGQVAMMFKEDGTPVWNPANYVAHIKDYDGGLRTPAGEEIKDPWNYVGVRLKGTAARGPVGSFGPPGTEGTKGGKGSWAPTDISPLLYKADGTAILNPEKYLANIKNYEGGLFSYAGEEVRNPRAYISGADRNVAQRGYSSSGTGRIVYLYKADGTPIKNPAAFVANIVSYDQPLYTNDWKPVRDPRAFVDGLIEKGLIEPLKGR
eukprot:TRINITY_DN11724_c0_g1_i1.p1 TRINITY_DN11724_c0_g1~~TRINITY_DN11724_c0_g1_i1.p1  ORF type:complete len:408 (+),score=55.14 TRINITY_DN11724_c0_g1_i1:104-1225(+)